MSSNLTKIRDMAASIKNKLASLTINPDALDDLDSVSSERVMLREKLATLEAAETVERDRLVAEEKKQNSKKRRAALTELATKSEQLISKHSDLTEQATDIINELVSVLIERENVFTQKSTGLDNPVFNELFSVDERSNLVYEMNRSAIGVCRGDFAVTFYDAIDKQEEDNCSPRLRHALRELFIVPQSHSGAIKGANSLLVNAAKAMQFKPVPEPATEPVVTTKPKKQGRHYVADMHDNLPVVEV